MTLAYMSIVNDCLIQGPFCYRRCRSDQLKNMFLDSPKPNKTMTKAMSATGNDGAFLQFHY